MFILVCLILSILFPKTILANNNFGLHLTQTSDINSAYSIINSSQGDWGWATIVLRTDQLDKNMWQEFMDNCRKYHIIPIIRISTRMENNAWVRPTFTDIDNLSNFLNSLNWPSTPQYITLFNEINHGQEWGGEVDIKNFVDTAIYATDKFKSLNPNFFILTPGLDLAAPEQPNKFKNFINVYNEIKLYKPEYFNIFDGLATHFYPQNSKKDFNSELRYFKKDIPIFITETGWKHERPYTCQAAATFTLNILRSYSVNPQVKAITPFIYNYPYPPFEPFSWVDKDEKLLPDFQIIVDEPKTKNTPLQTTNLAYQRIHLPILMFSEKEYQGQIFLKNTGQSIWGEIPFCLKPLASTNITLDPLCTDNTLIFPGQTKIFSFKFKIDSTNLFAKSYIAWEKVGPIEITPLTSNSVIYRPKTGLKQQFLDFIRKITKKLIK